MPTKVMKVMTVPAEGMKVMRVTRTRVEEIEILVDATGGLSAEEARLAAIGVTSAIPDCAWDSNIVAYAVAEVVIPPEYRIVVWEDPDYQIGTGNVVGIHEKRALAVSGACGFELEMRSDTRGDWESIASCYGFLGSDTGFDQMLEHAASLIPEGYVAPIMYGELGATRYVGTQVGTKPNVA